MTTSLLMSKVIDISEARRLRERRNEVTTMHSQDKRRETRHYSDQKAFVQIVACPNARLIGTTISCLALDVSPSGIRIEADEMIPEGSHLDIWIDNDMGPGKYFLSSTVRWAVDLDHSWQAGVELHEGAATDIDLWRSQYAAH